jgi:hypothetical protein
MQHATQSHKVSAALHTATACITKIMSSGGSGRLFDHVLNLAPVFQIQVICTARDAVLSWPLKLPMCTACGAVLCIVLALETAEVCTMRQ